MIDKDSILVEMKRVQMIVTKYKVEKKLITIVIKNYQNKIAFKKLITAKIVILIYHKKQINK